MITIVISAVNLRKGGTLTILRNCLEYLSELAQSGEYKVVALVHKKELAYYPGIEYVEMPWTIRSWFLRLWCEYVSMYRFSCKMDNIDLWFSLHDTTPRVKAKRRAVYCHNPFPFYRWKWKELLLNYRIVCFAWFSKYCYQINIHKNNSVLVQQEWIRQEFTKLFHLAPKDIVVSVPTKTHVEIPSEENVSKDDVYRFFYASYADIHKNFELLCQATELLEQEVGRGVFKVGITISGNENRYARRLYRKWGHVDSLHFTGFLTKTDLYSYYANTDCLVFPSRIETWGLPISEFAQSGKPMLLADLPYAHETAAGSVQTGFFNPNDANDLKEQMKRLLMNDKSLLAKVPEREIIEPVAYTWKELFDKLLK